MHLAYTAPKPTDLDPQLETFLKFWNKRADELVLVRLLANPTGNGETDVACARNGTDLARLIKTAARERYVAPDGSPRVYQGVYARLCHQCPPRDWLDPSRPKLTAAAAASFPGFVIDIDPFKAVAGGSSSDAELQETQRVADEISGWMDSVLGLDRSYALRLMSGNGVQIGIRVDLAMDQAGLARMLLMRMRGRWPAVDPNGSKMTVGPAVPCTLKAKGKATEDRPHRVVRILDSREGDRRLTAEELGTLIAALPEVPNETAVTRRGPARDAFSAVMALPIADVLEKLFGARSICPVCKSTDGAVAVTDQNILVCQHKRRCPAADRSGFTSAHVYGVALELGWDRYTQDQCAEIVEAARSDGWKLVWDDGEDPVWPAEQVAALESKVATLFVPEPDRKCRVVTSGQWTINGSDHQLLAERVSNALKRAYCPDWVDPRPGWDGRSLVFCGRMYVYHQELGIWVTISPTTDVDRVSRILKDQQEEQSIWAYNGKNTRLWAPSADHTLKNLERETPLPEFFREGKVGLACRDGFLELVGQQWAVRPHHPENHARGRINRTCEQVLRDIEEGAGNAAIQALREILCKTLQRDDLRVDELMMAFTEQVGGVICRVRPELRSALFLHGGSDTGKSSLLKIAKAMAERVGLTVTGSSLADLNGTFPDEALLTSDFNICMEEGAFDGGRKVAPARLKQIVEGSQWSFARKHQSNIQVSLDLLWMSASNREPSFAESSGALAKRSVIVPYPDQRVAVLDLDMIPRYLDRHLDGIIAASLTSAARLSVSGRTVLSPDGDLARHTLDVGRSMSLVEAWLQSGAEPSTDNANDTLFDDAHAACIAWSRAHGMQAEGQTLEISQFSRELQRFVARDKHRGFRWSNGNKLALVTLKTGSFGADEVDDSKSL